MSLHRTIAGAGRIHSGPCHARKTRKWPALPVIPAKAGIYGTMGTGLSPV